MSLKRDELLAALKTAEPALATKGLYPALENFLFKDKTVTAYDDILGMRVPFAGGIDGCLPGKTILGVLSASGAAEVEVTENGSSEVQLKLGRSKVTLPLGNEDEFKFDTPPLKEAAAVPCSEELIAALTRASVAVGWDTLQPWSFGVTLALGKKRSNFYATNNLSILRVAAPAVGAGAFIMPPRFVETLLRQAKKDAPKQLYLWEEGAMVAADFESGAVLYCRTTPEADEAKFLGHLDSLKGEAVDIPKGLEGTLLRTKVFLTSPVSAERVATFQVRDEKLVVLVETDRGTLRDVHKFPGHADVTLKAPPELLLAGLKYATHMAVLPEKAVRLEGEGFEYLIAGSV